MVYHGSVGLLFVEVETCFIVVVVYIRAWNRPFLHLMFWGRFDMCVCAPYVLFWMSVCNILIRMYCIWVDGHLLKVNRIQRHSTTPVILQQRQRNIYIYNYNMVMAIVNVSKIDPKKKRLTRYENQIESKFVWNNLFWMCFVLSTSLVLIIILLPPSLFHSLSHSLSLSLSSFLSLLVWII